MIIIIDNDDGDNDDDNGDDDNDDNDDDDDDDDCHLLSIVSSRLKHAREPRARSFVSCPGQVHSLGEGLQENQGDCCK